MGEVVAPWALTNKSRIKDRLSITSTSFDALFDRLIGSVSDYIESQCNRRFKKTTYTDEIYSIFHDKQEFIFLKQAPVTALTKVQYRAGTPETPNWTDYIRNNYDLVNDGASGMVKIYGGAVKGINAMRITYDAGYLISFADAGDITKHNLPADLTDMAERLVVRWFKRREVEGKASEAFQGATVSWLKELNEEDKETINKYRKVMFAV